MVLLVLFILIGCSLCNGYVDLKANRFSNSNIKLQQLKQSRYLEDMVSRKVVEVENLLRRHSAEDDPLMMRLSYQSTSSFYNVTRSIRKPGGPKDDHMMSIIVDVKKKSPTIPSQRNVVDFSCAADYCCLLSNVGVDALLINTDDVDYGGSWDDLQLTSRALEKLNRATTPACIAKDVFIHPIQIAKALHHGATGVVLMASVLGKQLVDMLDACTLMGAEALVEVHTLGELENALSNAAPVLIVNMWDRLSGKHFADMAKYLSTMIPMHCVTVATGDIHSLNQVYELGYCGYDGIVLGRRIIELPDIKGFIQSVHNFRGLPRIAGMGMKSSSYVIDNMDKVLTEL